MTNTVHVLDDYYLGITAIITVAYQLFFFAIAFTCQFDKLTDLAGGTNFAILAIITLALSGSPNPRQIVASVFLIVWALRLSGFLFFRILRTGKDDRFDDMRGKFFSFLTFWILQMIWVWAVSLPVTILNSPNTNSYPSHDFGTGRDIAGTVMYFIGFLVESISDVQRYRFRSNHDGIAVCNKGLFSVSRHPNYFGDIIVQFAIFMIAVSPAADGFVTGKAYKALYATIVGPITITLLLIFVSGIRLSERPKAKSRYEKGNNWEEYKRWLNRTSILIPFPPRLYEKMPTILKRTIFLEFPMFVFDPAKHSDIAQPGDGQAPGDGEHNAGGANGSRQSDQGMNV